MGDQLKEMIDKLKKSQEIKDEPPTPPPSLKKPEPKKEPEPKPEPKKELSNDQKLAISNRVQELQNNGLFRLEMLISMEELKTSVDNLTLVISSLIKQD